MKKIITQICFMLLFVTSAFAQAPGIFNYQGVARNAVGNVLANKNITLRLTIKNATASGITVYAETRAVTTNAYGLFNVQVGSAGATNVTGTVLGVNWAVANKFLQVEIDVNGGSSFIVMGTTQLASVPFALNAATALPAGPAAGDLGGTYPNPILANSGVVAGSYGNATSYPTFTVDSKGRITLASMQNLPAALPPNGPAGGDLAGIYPNPILANSGVAAGSYGNTTSYPTFTVDNKGRITLASTQTFPAAPTTLPPNGPAGGDLAGTYPNPTVVKIQTRPLSAAVPNANDILQFNGTTWIPAALPAAPSSIGGSGTLNFISKFTPSGTAIGNSQLFDDGINVGLGTTTPTYKFDLLHGGSGGARIKSSASFSALDIDGFTGDAALRFANNGTNKWNIRNRPADDYFEFFELGGGGSRMVIQRTSGNVGIGETTNPLYKLDVLHGGSIGQRIKSSAGFSNLDIDAFTGDAAIRFANNGTNKWNIRNRPADDNFEFFELGGGGSRMVIQRTSGNVGIGETTNPLYKLDILHGGGGGTRIKSSASFSALDIDAATGDAALRFVANGTNQWNLRNRPSDNYFELFELGGGGSRVVVQDATGNVGIGETTNPLYKLDILHGGGGGTRIKSSASFSALDIDAATGDAALRFLNNGTNQWNIRNNPANNDLQFFKLGGGGERMRIEAATGNVAITGNLSKGGGSFKIDDPIDPENKYLYHSFVESPDMMNIYNGNITTDANGKATVELPKYFEALNMEFRYQLTVIGAFAQAIINKEVVNNQFEIATNQPNIKVSWQVTGIRHDAYANQNRIPNEVEKDVKDKGNYLHPKAFNQPISKAINYDVNENSPSSLTEMKAPVYAKKVVAENEVSSVSTQIAKPTAKSTVIDNSGSVADQPVIANPSKVIVLEPANSSTSNDANKKGTKDSEIKKGSH